MSTPTIEQPFGLAGFEIKSDLNEIVGPKGIERVNPKAMEVLLALAGRPGELFTKAELLDAVWTDLFVGDEVLSNAVWELRRALGDSAREPRFIQTVSRKGYRLMVAPEALPTGAPSPPDRVTATASWSPVTRIIAPLLAVVAVAAVMVMSFGDRNRSPSKIHSLVVLPIDNLGDNPRDQALADGLTDTLITSLAGIDGLRVVSRSTSMAYRDREVTMADVASELGVDAVFEGSLARSEGRVVLNAQLIDAGTDDHLWAKTYERRFENLLDLQVEVANTIGAAISSRLEPPGSRPAPAPDQPPPGDTLLHWRFRTGGEVWSQPVQVGDSAVFGSRDGWLYSVALADGRERWRLRIGDEVMTMALVLDGTVISAAHDGTIVAAAVDDGAERWRFRIGSTIETPPVGENGVVVAADEAGRVAALDAWSGRELWSNTVEGGVLGLACSQGIVVVSAFDGHVILMDSVDGRPRWRARVAEWLGQPATIDNHQVLVPSHEGHVIALAVSDGVELWRSTSPAPSQLAVWRDRIVSGGEGEVITALDRSSGAELWRFDALGGLTTPTVAEDTVFAGSRDNNLYALDAWTGSLKWRAEMRTWVTTGAALADGHVVFGSLDGSVRCIAVPAFDSAVVRETDGFVAAREDGDERLRGFDIVADHPGTRRPRVRWRHGTDGPVIHQPLFAGSTILASGYRTLTALDRQTGDPLWVQRLPGEAGTAPVAVGDDVVVGTRDGFVISFGQTSGEEHWRFRTGGAVISTPRYSEDALFFGSRDGYVYSLDSDTGGERWRRQLDTIHASPLVIGGEVWVAARGDALWVLDERNGRVLRSVDTPDWAVADPVAAGDRVVVASSAGTVTAYARKDLKELWSFTAHGEIWYRPLAHDGHYFFGSGDHHVYALDFESGRELWRRRTGNRALSSVAFWEGLVFVGSHDRSLHALSVADGRPHWRLATTGIMNSPTVHGDELAVGGFDGFVYLLELR